LFDIVLFFLLDSNMIQTTVTFFAILVLFFLISSPSVTAFDDDLGQYQFSKTSISFESQEWYSEIELVTDHSIIFPTLSVTVRDLPSANAYIIPSQLSEILKVDSQGHTKLRALQPKGTRSAGTPLSMSTSTFIFCMATVLFFPLLRSQASSLTLRNAALILMCLVSGISVTLIMAESNQPWYQITLQVPAGETLDSLRILQNGKILGSGVSARILVLDVCTKSNLASEIKVNFSEVVEEISLCANDLVSVESLTLLGTGTTGNLTSPDGIVDVTFSEDFAGYFSIYGLETLELLHTDGACILGIDDPDYKTGSCGDNNLANFFIWAAHSSLDIKGIGSAITTTSFSVTSPTSTRNTGATSTRNTGATSTRNTGGTGTISTTTAPVGFSTTPDSFIPSSWNVEAMTQSGNITHGVDAWFLGNPWNPSIWPESSPPTYFRLEQIDSNSFLFQNANSTIDNYLISLPGTIDSLVYSYTYTVEFSISQDIYNSWWVDAVKATVKVGNPVALHNLTLAIGTFATASSLRYTWASAPGVTGNKCGGSPTSCFIVGQKVWTSISIPTGAPAKYSITFTAEKDHKDPQILIRIRDPGWSRYNASRPQPWGNTFTISDVKITRHVLARSLTAITKLAELVEIPVAPRIDLPPKTDCPHEQQDLVSWFSPDIWSNGVPLPDGSEIVLPENKKVLVSSKDPDFQAQTPGQYYGTIWVPESSQLIFDDADLDWQVTNIFLNGALWMGSETCRLASKITLTFNDAATTMGSRWGSKGLVTNSTGQLEIHGALFQPSWTRLTATALKLDDRIKVWDDVSDWQVGQQVFITTTHFNDSVPVHQNEIKTLAEVSGKMLRFTTPLEFSHYGGTEYQAEVGLLTRNIKIQGDEASAKNTFGGRGGNGVHILLTSPLAHVSGLEIYRGGQTNHMARYSFHFHMIGNASGAYITDSSIHSSFYRCITVHGSNSTKVSRNTCFDILGNAIYIEDGVEELNRIEYNLGAFINPILPTANPTGWFDFINPPSDNCLSQNSQCGVEVISNDNVLIPADVAPAAFYNTNPNNEWYGNAASGGFTGYSFVQLPEAIGLHVDKGFLSPMNRPLKLFDGNTVHSASWQWGTAAGIYSGGQLQLTNASLAPANYTYLTGRVQRDTKLSNGTKLWMTFKNVRVAQTPSLGIGHWGQRADIIHFEAHDVGRAAMVFGESSIQHAILNQQSNNPSARSPSNNFLFQYYDISVKTVLYDVTFKNVVDLQIPYTVSRTNNYGLESLDHSNLFAPQGINVANKITWENVPDDLKIGHAARGTKASRQFTVADWDGSLTGRGQRALLAAADTEWFNTTDVFKSTYITKWLQKWFLLEDANCELKPLWTCWICNKPDKYEVANVMTWIPGVTDSDSTSTTSTDPDNIGTVSQFGFSGSDRRMISILSTPGVTGITGDNGWYWYFDKFLGSPQTFEIYPAQIPKTPQMQHHVVTAYRYPSSATFNITTWHKWDAKYSANVTQVFSKSDLMANVKGWAYWFDTSANDGYGYLYLKLMDMNVLRDPAGEPWFERQGTRVYDLFASNAKGPYKYTVIVSSCDGCTINTYTPADDSKPQTIFYEVPDKVPPFW
jgi:hypothetical protein